jgi:hypothetical protein
MHIWIIKEKWKKKINKGTLKSESVANHPVSLLLLSSKELGDMYLHLYFLFEWYNFIFYLNIFAVLGFELRAYT